MSAYECLGELVGWLRSAWHLPRYLVWPLCPEVLSLLSSFLSLSNISHLTSPSPSCPPALLPSYPLTYLPTDLLLTSYL